jgi:predicted RNase H-like HicB family nuclease
MILHCVITKTSNDFFGECLELSVAAVGDTLEKCRQQLEEAVMGYLDVLNQHKGERFVFRKTSFYWLKRVIFIYRYWKQQREQNKSFYVWTIKG